MKTCHPSIEKTGLGKERCVPCELIFVIYSHGDHSCEGIEKREFSGGIEREAKEETLENTHISNCEEEVDTKKSMRG